MTELSGPAGQAFFPLDPRHLPGPPQAWHRRPYPQLLRGPNYAWWRALISAVVFLGGVGVTVVAMAAATVAVMGAEGALNPDGDVSSNSLESWSTSPSGLLLTNLSVAAFIVCAQAAVWAGFGWRPRWLASVAGGIRWRVLAIAFVAAVVLLVTVTVVADLILAATTDHSAGLPMDPEQRMVSYLLVIALTTPLQAAGEEYLFRGWLTQAIGSWFARAGVGAVVAALVSGTAFAFAHGQQDAWLFADRFAFALAASWLVWRTGGLEFAIALHTAYNMMAFGVALALGRLSGLLETTESDPAAMVINLLLLVVVVAALDLLARRLGLQREFRPPGVP